MDGLDAMSVGEAVAKAQPDAIVHQMTAIAGKPDMRHMDRWFATTNRLRTEGTDHLLAAAEAADVSHVRRAELRQLERNPPGRLGEDRGGPAGPARGDGGAPGDGGDRPRRGRGRQGGWRGPALRLALRAGRHRRSGRARAQAAIPGGRGRHRLLLVGASGRRGERYRPGR